MTLRAGDAYFFDSEKDVKMEPVRLEVSLPAHSSQDALYTMCTQMRSPSEDDFVFAGLAPTQNFEWVTGDLGNATYSEVG